jgi:hypothetical protein
MIKRIYISTNETLHGIFNFDNGNLAKLNTSNLTLLKVNNEVYFNGETFDTNSKASSIIIVSDSSETKLTGIKAETDLLLHHTQTESHIKNVVEKFDGKKVQGRHPDLYYTDVFKIIFNDEITDKLSEILKILGFTDKQIEEKETLESKLNFLHHCLTPEELEQAELKDEWNANNEFGVLKSVASDGPFGDNYLSALRTLRDKLLLS